MSCYGGRELWSHGLQRIRQCGWNAANSNIHRRLGKGSSVGGIGLEGSKTHDRGDYVALGVAWGAKEVVRDHVDHDIELRWSWRNVKDRAQGHQETRRQCTTMADNGMRWSWELGAGSWRSLSLGQRAGKAGAWV